jgi:hypothetical protein
MVVLNGEMQAYDVWLTYTVNAYQYISLFEAKV